MKSISSFSSLSPLTSSSDLENEDPKSSCLVYTPPFNQRRRTSYRANIGGLGLAALLYDEPSHHHDPPHFLDSCFLCKRRIGRHCDIFMYRGNIPFCSEECRQEQIEKDEEEERLRSLSLKMKSHTLKQKTKEKKGINTNSPPKSQTNKVHLRTGSVAVAG